MSLPTLGKSWNGFERSFEGREIPLARSEKIRQSGGLHDAQRGMDFAHPVIETKRDDVVDARHLSFMVTAVDTKGPYETQFRR